MCKLHLTILTIIMLSLCGSLHAQPSKLLTCLAFEEQNIHKQKIGGAIYKLNQQFINEFTQVDKLQLLENYYQVICKMDQNQPSLQLLKYLLTKKEKIFFEINISNDETALTKQGLEDIIQRAPKIFLGYLAQIQAEMPIPNCLNSQIPELSKIEEDFRYLEEHLSSQQILEAENKLDIIILKLSNLEAIKKNCQLLLEKEKKD